MRSPRSRGFVCALAQVACDSGWHARARSVTWQAILLTPLAVKIVTMKHLILLRAVRSLSTYVVELSINTGKDAYSS